MPFNQFQLSIDTGILESPNDHYRNLAQAFQDEQWDNTSTKTPEKDGVILEQDGIGLRGLPPPVVQRGIHVEVRFR